MPSLSFFLFKLFFHLCISRWLFAYLPSSFHISRPVLLCIPFPISPSPLIMSLSLTLFPLTSLDFSSLSFLSSLHFLNAIILYILSCFTSSPPSFFIASFPSYNITAIQQSLSFLSVLTHYSRISHFLFFLPFFFFNPSFILSLINFFQ